MVADNGQEISRMDLLLWKKPVSTSLVLYSLRTLYVVKMLPQDDYDGFNDRQLYVCPKERDVNYDELIPFDNSTIHQLKPVYQFIQKSTSVILCTLWMKKPMLYLRNVMTNLRTEKLPMTKTDMVSLPRR
jgi:hypothetical protein